ncbi:MAG TPA: hypothetical protein VM260_07945 [Pirellula sp.]|nr:hypothetical protein [Pirellula sp.]
MKRLSQPILCIIILAILSASGCRLCCSPYTDDYVTFGSRTPRLDMKHGRVGSILSDNQSVNSSFVDEPVSYVDYQGENTATDEQSEDAISLGAP